MNNYLLPVTFDQITLNLVKTHKDPLIIIGSGGLAYYFLHIAMDKNNLMGQSNAIWNVFSSISGVILGILLYNEKYSLKKVIGIGLSIPALYLMNSG